MPSNKHTCNTQSGSATGTATAGTAGGRAATARGTTATTDPRGKATSADTTTTAGTAGTAGTPETRETPGTIEGPRITTTAGAAVAINRGGRKNRHATAADMQAHKGA